jgi:ATP-binding cassette subfamily B protein
MRLLLPFLKPDAGKIILILLLVPAMTAIGVAQPLILKNILDGHIIAGKSEGLQQLALYWLGLALLSFATGALHMALVAATSENTILRIRKALYRQILSLSQHFFERQPTGQILSRATSDVDALNEAITGGSITLLFDGLTIVAVLGAMIWLDWRITFLLILIGPVLAWIITWIQGRMRALFAQIRDALAALNAYLAERLAGVELIQLYGLEDRMQARFSELDGLHRDANVKNNWYDAFLYAFIDGLSSICIAVVLGGGAWAAGHAEAAVSVGTVVAFVDYVERLFRPLRELSSKLTFLQRAAAALEKIGWLLSIEDRITPGTTLLEAPKGRLKLQNVSFRYREDGPWILQNISLMVEPGEVVAVVGRTGAGKSTLVRLLARIHDGYTGSITVDGVELNQIAPASVRRVIGMVRQEVQLFGESLAFNVSLGDPTLDPERIDAAIKTSNLASIASRYSEGLAHPVQDRGTNLSSGEAQILALARTLARDPAIVILDEATASVDPLTEALLQEALDRTFKSTTCLVIAHRLSTITSAHRIVVLDGGKVVEQGSHEALLAQKGAYAALYEAGVSSTGSGSPERSLPEMRVNTIV